MSRLRILISEPNGVGVFYFPYIWAILKSHWEHFGSNPDAFEWLDPLFERDRVAQDLDNYFSEPVDVLGLSCYTWNWELNRQVARRARELNPNCLVVAGGPDPDYKDPDYFRKNPDVDMIVVKDGEIPFTRILETVLKGSKDFTHIPGLYLPSRGVPVHLANSQSNIAHFYTGTAEVPTVFDYSPYVEQSDLYERIKLTNPDKYLSVTWETNRGCPYSCSYCDWGSATMAKVRQFDISRVNAELEWFAKMRVGNVTLSDANFGILARDVTIADTLVEVRKRTGYPLSIYYSSAKNNPDRTIEITVRLYNSGITEGHILSVQHTDNDVLAATDRSNIPASKYREVVAQLAVLGIPSEVQLILGIPGDTLEKWKSCLAEMMEWGVHDNFQISPYCLLPNAPAAEPEFKRKWQIDTVERGMIPYGGSKVKAVSENPKNHVVVSSSTFSREDWVESSIYSSFVRAYHNRAVTRLPAIYLRFVHGVSYREFYDAIIEEFVPGTELLASMYSRVREVFLEFLSNPDSTDEMEYEDLPSCNVVGDPSKWVYVKTCLNVDDFYINLSRFLVRRFPRAKNLQSAIDYQRNLLVLPEYSSRDGKSFTINCDWPAFFYKASSLVNYEKLDEPTRFHLPRIAEIAQEDRSGFENRLDFGDGSGEERWNRWVYQTVRKHNTALSSNLPRPIIIKPSLATSLGLLGTSRKRAGVGRP